MSLLSNPRLVVRSATKTFGPNALAQGGGLPPSAGSHCKATAKPLASTADSPGRTPPGWSPLCEAGDGWCCRRGCRDMEGWALWQQPGDIPAAARWAALLRPCLLSLLRSSLASGVAAAMTVGTAANPAQLTVGLRADNACLFLLHPLL